MNRLRLWPLYSDFVRVARKGFFVGLIPICIIGLVTELYAFAVEWLFLAPLSGAAPKALELVVGLIFLASIGLLTFLMCIDLLWIALTAPKQIILGSAFASKRVEADNAAHLDWLRDKCSER